MAERHAARLCCERVIRSGLRLHAPEVTSPALGLPDGAAFAQFTRLRRFRCVHCGSAEARAVPT